MRQPKATSRTQKLSECAIAQVMRCRTRVVRKHLCYVEVSGRKPRWLSHVRRARFRRFDGRSEKRPDAPGEPEDHSETFHDSSGSLRGRSSEPDGAGVDSLEKSLGSTVKVLTKDVSTLQVF